MEKILLFFSYWDEVTLVTEYIFPHGVLSQNDIVKRSENWSRPIPSIGL